MSTDNANPTTPKCDAEQPACCCCSHKKCFITTLIILIVVIGGAWIAQQQLGGKLRATAPYKAAMQAIHKSPALKDALGEPITDAWITAEGADGKEMLFKISGPKGNARVKLEISRQAGKLELQKVKVTTESKQEEISVFEAEGDAPRYAAPAPVQTQTNVVKPADAPKPAESAAPQQSGAPVINMPMPPADAPK